MTAISASAVKDLREKTGAGMMDCKKALEETKGDIEQAVDWLRKKGIATAGKKAGRVAAEGVIGIASSADAKQAAIIELNSETDFVSKNEEFQQAATNIANIALAKTDGDVEAVKTATCNTLKVPVSEIVTNLVAKIGENINLRRAAKLTVSNGIVATYLHNAVTAGLGKIGVLVALESTAPAAKLQEVGKQIAMHIAAAKPDALTREEVKADSLEREKAIFIDQAKASGKPDNVIEKMVDGRINKYYAEVVLLEQPLVMDGKTKVSDYIAQAGKEAGAEIKLTGFKLFILGQGIEKQAQDFAAEVAATAAAAG
jgi:elongation factor Ts